MMRAYAHVGLTVAALAGCAHEASNTKLEPPRPELTSDVAPAPVVAAPAKIDAAESKNQSNLAATPQAQVSSAKPALEGASCTGAAGAGADCNGESCCARIPVPGGDFDMNLDGFGRTVRVSVKPFVLDKYEATVGRVRAWLNAGQPLPEDGEVLYDDGEGKPLRWSSKTKVQDAKALVGWARYDTFTGGNELRPKNFINWNTALAFCHFDGGRLPTEAEWKYAVAGGSEGRAYPWGAEAPTPQRAVFNCMGDGDKSCALADILPVGSRPAGAGRWGHMDLAGSMFEWTMSKDTAGGYSEGDETSRGGGFCYIGGVDRRARTDLKPLVFRKESAETVSHMVGVRCAYSPKS